MNGNRPWMVLRHALTGFARSQGGGGMLVAGVFLLITMAVVGERMTNYAWREAQWEEIRAAVRAAVASSGSLLADPGANVVAISERVAEFATAALGGLTVEAGGVAVSHDAGTDITTVVVGGGYVFDTLWGRGDRDGDVVAIEHTVKTRLENDRYEVAMALDVTPSMDEVFPPGRVKLEALKEAVDNVANTLEVASRTVPGSILVSVVPFGTVVNAADTCNPDETTGACRADRSAGKERYLRMLAGARGTLAASLADARAARASGESGHWVDTFHQYGAGQGLGPLRHRFLPADLLDDRDWNLRREDVDIDVSALAPGLDTWTVRDADFWNGCLMARWGAYWDTSARPPGWRPDHPGNWPATKAVPAWSPRAPALPDDTPLHLSDAPPTARDPHTLFTAYSWPDARVSGHADHLLQGTMLQMQHPDAQATNDTQAADWPTSADNDWSLADHRGGSTLCPESPVIPLTDDFPALRRTMAALTTIEGHRASDRLVAGTYLNLGVVWALRTLSPLWQDVWHVRDHRGVPRPGIPCAPGDDPTGCDGSLVKSLLLVTDGVNFPTRVVGGRTLDREDHARNASWNSVLCDHAYGDLGADYHEAARTDAPWAFNRHFSGMVDANGRLNTIGRDLFADGFLRMAHDTGNADRRRALLDTLSAPVTAGVAATPWQLFRGRDVEIVNALVAPDSGFDLDGRPVLIDNRCRLSSAFSAYGRIDDLVYIGETGETPRSSPVPVSGAAPFRIDENDRRRWALPRHAPYTDSKLLTQFPGALTERLDEWLFDACALAGRRGVRINAIYIGDATRTSEIGVLEQCVDAAGGNPSQRDVFVTPGADDLIDAFEQVFTIRRNLRFFSPDV
ncbi:MAG: hypothetical protein OXG82_08245 [Gammaproteobacteria bacterium]|nr:hypothetical protein [Gammaproteobacteria bacterium]